MAAPERLPVIVNASGGTAAREGDGLKAKLAAAFEAAGLAIDLRLVEGSALTVEIEKHRGVPTIVVGGGDGTLGSAAGILAGSDTALGILPLGTLNHLARDLGIPADLTEAARLIAGGSRRRIDLGRVADQVFVNNASIGFYPEMVEEREARAAPKWLAAVPAVLATLRRLPHHRLRLRWAGQEKQVVTPMLFVGNGSYSLALGSLGQREDLADGKLSIYAVGRRSRLKLVGLALRTLVGRADRERDFATLASVAELTVAGAGHRLHVAFDGEVAEFTLPLEFRCERQALTVIAPPA